jgi:hypothetical protein
MSSQRLEGLLAGTHRRRLGTFAMAGLCVACAGPSRISPESTAGGRSNPEGCAQTPALSQYVLGTMSTDPIKSYWGSSISVGYYIDHFKHGLPPALMALPSVAEKDIFLPGTNRWIGAFRHGPSAPPRHVQLCGALAAHFVDHFRNLGLAAPEKFEVRLLDHSDISVRGTADPNDTGEIEKKETKGPIITIEISLQGEELSTTIVHEVFHLVQFQYNDLHSSTEIARYPNISLKSLPEGARHNRVDLNAVVTMREGTARLVEMLAHPDSGRWLESARPWFLGSGHPLVQPFALQNTQVRASYSSSFFFAYVMEQHGQRADGADVLRAWLTSTAKNRPRPESIGLAGWRRARASLSGPGHFDQFHHLDTAGQECVSDETTWGNFVLALALNGTATRDSRFRFGGAADWRGAVSDRMAIAPGRSIAYERLPLSWSTALPEEGFSEMVIAPDNVSSPRTRDLLRDLFGSSAGEENTPPIHALLPYGTQAWRVTLPADDEMRLMRVRFTPRRLLGDAIVQVVLLDRGGALLDVIRYKQAPGRSFDRVVACAGAAELLILVAACEESGNFELGLSRIENRALLFAASWNRAAFTHYSTDPRQKLWTWRSPDLWIEPGNKFLKLRLTNRGTEQADNVRIEFFRRRVWPGGIDAKWTPVCGPPGGMIDADGLLKPLTIRHRADCVRRNAYAFPGAGSGCGRAPLFEENIIPFPWPDGDPAQYLVMARIGSADSGLPRRRLRQAEPPLIVLTSPGGTPPPCPEPFRYT